MCAKTLISTIVLLQIFGLVATAQQTFSVETEIKYMQLIENQEECFLIENNLFDAEMVANQILQSDTSKPVFAQYFLNLSRQYQKIEQFDKAIYTLFRLRCMQALPELNEFTENQIRLLAPQSTFSENQINAWLRQSSSERLTHTYLEQLKVLMVIAFEQQALESDMKFLAQLYRKATNGSNPYWYNQVVFLQQIGANTKNYKQLAENYLWNNNDNLLVAGIRADQQMELAYKAASYYCKQKMYNRSLDYLYFLEANNTNPKLQQKVKNKIKKLEKKHRS